MGAQRLRLNRLIYATLSLMQHSSSVVSVNVPNTTGGVFLSSVKGVKIWIFTVNVYLFQLLVIDLHDKIKCVGLSLFSAKLHPLTVSPCRRNSTVLFLNLFFCHLECHLICPKITNTHQNNWDDLPAPQVREKKCIFGVKCPFKIRLTCIPAALTWYADLSSVIL